MRRVQLLFHPIHAKLPPLLAHAATAVLQPHTSSTFHRMTFPVVLNTNGPKFIILLLLPYCFSVFVYSPLRDKQILNQFYTHINQNQHVGAYICIEWTVFTPDLPMSINQFGGSIAEKKYSAQLNNFIRFHNWNRPYISFFLCLAWRVRCNCHCCCCCCCCWFFVQLCSCFFSIRFSNICSVITLQ